MSGSTISGSSICVMASTRPNSVNIRVIGDAVRPSATKASLMGPCLPRMTIQAKVRTTLLVSIGMSVRRTSTCRHARPAVPVEQRDRDAEHRRRKHRLKPQPCGVQQDPEVERIAEELGVVRQ